MKIDEALREVRVSLGGQTYTFDELFVVDETNLNAEFGRQAGLYAYLVAELSKAEAAWNEAKANRELEYAEADLAIREDYAKSGQKSTEALIKSEVTVDERYVKSGEIELQAAERYRLLRGLADAMRQRGDMLISLGANLRQERDFTDMKLYDAKRVLREDG